MKGKISFYKGIILDLIRRPEMFVGKVNLDRISLFLSGFIIAHDNYGLSDKEVNHYKLFDDYVQNHFQEITTIGWPDLIASRFKDKDEQLKVFKELITNHFEQLG